MKQETLEEAAEKYANELPEPYNYGINSDKKKGFIEGAKWQQERSYSREDMAEAFIACWKVNVPNGIECKVSFNDWFEQFKKK